MERFDYKGIVIFLEKDIINEAAFTEKGWFVQKALESGVEYQDAVAMANIWINVKFNKCTYNNEIMQMVTSLAQKM